MGLGGSGRYRRSVRVFGERHAILLAGSVVSVGLALWMSRGAWGGRPPAGDDVMAHLVRADFGLAHITGRGRLDGWFPRFMLGHEEFLFYGPGFTWLLGFLRLVTFGSLSTTGAMKVAAVGGFVAFGPAALFLARSMGLSELASAVAGVLALAVNNVFGVGLAGIFVIGLVPQQIAAVLACLAIGAGLRTLVDGRARWPVIGALGLAAIALVHVITVFLVALFGGLAVLALVATDRPSLRAWGRLVLAAAGAVALIGFWAVPFFAHRDLRGPVTTWATPPIGQRVRDVLAGRILFGPRIGWLVVAGAIPAAVLVLRRRRFGWALLLTPAAFLVIGHNAIHLWPKNEIAIQLANRGLGYAGLVGLFPVAIAVAVGVAALVRFVGVGSGVDPGAGPGADPGMGPGADPGMGPGRASVGPGRASVGPGRAGVVPGRTGVVAPAAALAVAVFVVVVLPGPSRSGASQAAQLGRPVPQMAEAAAELAQAVPTAARFATERNFPQEIDDTGVSHPDFWLARASRRNTLNVFNLESSSVHGVVFTPDAIGRQSPDGTADALQRLGVTHVVTVRPATAAALVDSGRFTAVWESPPLAVLALVPTAGRPPPASLLSTPGTSGRAALTRSDPEHLRLTTDTAAATTASMAVAWSPQWHLSVDGRSHRLTANADGLLAFVLPAGHHAVALDYRSDGWDHLGLALTAATALGGLGWVGRRMRRRRPLPTRRPYRLRRSSSVSSSRMSSSRSFTA
jgi:hypothetical protein